MNENDILINEINETLFTRLPVSSGNASGAFSCVDYPGDASQRLTLYVDENTLILEEDKLCGNWATTPGNACQDRERRYRLPRDKISMVLGYKCSNGRIIMQVEFGLSEAMTKVYPLKRGEKCGINDEGEKVRVHNKDFSRVVEVDVEIDSIPAPTNLYPVVKSIRLHPGEFQELGCSEKNQASRTFKIIDARFV
ncbi:hypothetical protein M8009_18590 [Halomonas sp. ATCH28]|uniref:ZP domain-containing protein n=1 Tax=Halomonas gemina TaxID=2945105 RepID=A0ABT0T673_9GAMM|nr:hypothetical protein [Halomonas gemina]MCL7942287.1 hypothetical protein [Halomonas gemina]